MITIIGLGVEKGDLTKRGEQAILNAAKENRKIVVRTAHTRSYETVLQLGVPHVTLDTVYETSTNFNALAKKLATAVTEQGEDAVYLVDGAATEDNSVKALVKRKRGKVTIIDGGHGGSGVDTMGSFVPSVLARTIETMKEVTGLDLVDVMKASTYDAKVNRNVTVQGDPQGAVKTALNEE